MNMFWNLGAIGRPFNEADRSASSLPSQPSDTTNVRILESEVERLTMVCEAMWMLLKDKLGVDDQELMARIAELDLSDGKADGRKDTDGPRNCPGCNRPNSKRHDFCIYCGQLIRTTPFD